MFRYSVQNGWQEIESFLHATGEAEIADELMACGFLSEPSFQIGAEDEFSVEVYRRHDSVGQYVAYLNPNTGKPLSVPKAIEAKDEYFAYVIVGSMCNEVVCPHLPDLLSLLSQLTPICREVRENSQMRTH
jgi:hypothetical protein